MFEAQGRVPYPMISGPTPRRRTTAARVGFTPGTGTAYRAITVNKWTAAVAAVASKGIVSDNVVAIARQTTGNEINLRERDMINCLGFSLRVCIAGTSSARAQTIRMALVSPTDKNEINDVEFFRGYGDRRTIDFSSTEDSVVLLNNPINRDNYVVLWEKKVTVGPTSDSAGLTFSRTQDSFVSFNTYVPLNRQLRYDGPSQNQCSENVFLLMWYDEPFGEGSQTPTTNILYRRYVVTHWKNPGQL